MTVPVLWDREQQTIVNNESADILRMLSTVFAPLAEHPGRALPAGARRRRSTRSTHHIYDHVNNGVYKAGFSTRQSIYERAVARAVHGARRARRAPGRAAASCSARQPLETDWRLFTTLIRFDAVYQIHFKCSLRKLAEYPNLWPYLRDLYQWPGVSRDGLLR